MNIYNFIDLNEPVNEAYDYRTSTYLANRNFKVYEQDIKTPYHDACKIFKKPGIYYSDDDYKSEAQRQYIFKNSNFTKYSRMTKSASYIKNYDDMKFNRVPRNIDTTYSIYRQSYNTGDKIPTQSKYFVGEVSLTKPCLQNNSFKKSDVEIDPEKPGHAKYLDLMATTNMLSYVKHSDERIYGIGAADNITLWNWSKIQRPVGAPLSDELVGERMCNINLAKFCPKLQKFPKKTKLVPNNGLRTEMQHSFKAPDRQLSERIDDLYPTEVTKNPFIMKIEKQPFPKCESTMYGSGDRIQKYLNASVNRK